MKLICLNAWMGMRLEALTGFLKQYSFDTDIFCFQEVLSSKKEGIVANFYPQAKTNLFQKLSEILSNFTGIFVPMRDGNGFEYGLAIFVNKKIFIENKGELFVHGERNDFDGQPKRMPSKLQWISFSDKGEKYTVFNFHGISVWPKNDSEERIMQSQKIKDILIKTNNPKILCGDFNLEPHTESLAIVSEGLRDLIKEYKIEATRSSLHPFNDEEGRVSDYIFVSPDIKIESFNVPQGITVSDHLPLIFEFI